MEVSKKIIVNPADMPKEVFDYYHERWAEYLNEHYKEHFAQSGVGGHSFMEKAPDSPSGTGFFSYSFDADGTMRFIENEGEAVVEYDFYEIGHRALADPNVDARKLMEEGKLRFIKNAELFTKLIPLIPLMREAYYAIVEDVEKKFNVDMPKYL